MTVFVLMDWGDKVSGVASSEAKARELGYVASSEHGDDSEGFFVECEVQD